MTTEGSKSSKNVDIFTLSAESGGVVVKPTRKSLTRREFLVIASLAYGNFCLGTIYSLMAPFFPAEAERKGVTPTQYGFIFGLYEFGMFLASPVVGKLMPHLTPKFILTIGVFICGWCMTSFGMLEWSPHGMVFFWSALILRLVSSVGGACFMTACFTIIAVDFPEKLSTLYATTEMCFGFGMIVGPSMGGLLFEIGDFSLPFFVAGGMCLFGATCLHFLLPDPKTTRKSTSAKVGVLDLLSNSGIVLNITITLTTFMNVGFNDATLEHHLRDFTTLSPSAVGGIFLVSGLIYALCSQVWGIVINKYEKSALPFSLIGYVLSLGFFVLSGPMYPIPVEPSLTLVIISQALYGISMGGQLVGSFTEGLRQMVKAGYSDDISTSAAMSSLYQSACSLGAAIGPAIGGYLMDNYGYRKASIFMVLLQIVMIGAIILYMLYEKYIKKDIDIRDNGKSASIEEAPSAVDTVAS